jgi:hypothetical protein
MQLRRRHIIKWRGFLSSLVGGWKGIFFSSCVWCGLLYVDSSLGQWIVDISSKPWWERGQSTNKNHPKCTHSIWWLDLGIFATIRSNFNYFGHSQNYDATIKIFILLVESILHLLSSINRLICSISRNNHQISCILKVFYNDIGVYFNVCTKIIY